MNYSNLLFPKSSSSSIFKFLLTSFPLVAKKKSPNEKNKIKLLAFIFLKIVLFNYYYYYLLNINFKIFGNF